MSNPSDRELIARRAADAIVEAMARPPADPIAYLPDGPRDQASIQARARTMSVRTGPLPLNFGPLRPVSIAPPPESTDAPPSESDLATGGK